MKNLYRLTLLLSLLCCNPSRAATLAVLQKNGEVYSMSTSTVSHPKKIAQLPAEGFDFVHAAGATGHLYALRADGAVFAVSPDGKVEPYSVKGWDDRISRIVFHDGNLYGLDCNLDKRANPQTRILDQSGSTFLELQMSAPEPAQDFAITGQGNPVFLSAAERPLDETYPHVTWAYTFSPGYRGPIAGSLQYLNFSNGLPGVLVRARGKDIHAISEKRDTGESLWQVIRSDQTDNPIRIVASDVLPLNVLAMEFSGENAIFLTKSGDAAEVMIFHLGADNSAALLFRAKPPLKNVVGMGVLD